MGRGTRSATNSDFTQHHATGHIATAMTARIAARPFPVWIKETEHLSTLFSAWNIQHEATPLKPLGFFTEASQMKSGNLQEHSLTKCLHRLSQACSPKACTGSSQSLLLDKTVEKFKANCPVSICCSTGRVFHWTNVEETCHVSDHTLPIDISCDNFKKEIPVFKTCRNSSNTYSTCVESIAPAAKKMLRSLIPVFCFTARIEPKNGQKDPSTRVGWSLVIT